MLRSFLFATVCLLPFTAKAEDTVRQVLKTYSSGASERAEVSTALAGIANGIYWSNVYAGEKTGLAFVCLGEGQEIKGEAAVSILRTHAKRYPGTLDLPAGMGMIAALSNKYPCQGAK